MIDTRFVSFLPFCNLFLQQIFSKCLLYLGTFIFPSEQNMPPKRPKNPNKPPNNKTNPPLQLERLAIYDQQNKFIHKQYDRVKVYILNGENEREKRARGTICNIKHVGQGRHFSEDLQEGRIGALWYLGQSIPGREQLGNDPRIRNLQIF